MYIIRIGSSWKTGGLLKFNETSLCSATRGTGRIGPHAAAAAIDRYFQRTGSRRFAAVGRRWDRQTDGQTDGHRIVSYTLLRILCRQYQ